MSFDRYLESVLCEYSEGQGLHPGFWEGERIRPEVRETLLQIAEDFAASHNIPEEAIEDITLTGSMANTNWSEFSDADVHIIAQLDMIDENAELVYDYFRLAKSIWNSEHNIQVCDHEVELYVQDSKEAHVSSGVYSLIEDAWIHKPSKGQSIKPDSSLVQQKADSIVARIDRVEQLVESDSIQAATEGEKLRDSIKRMRKAGLHSGGEFSVENLAFKMLRNHGQLDRLSDLRKLAYDKSMTMQHCEEGTMKLNRLCADTIAETNDPYGDTHDMPRPDPLKKPQQNGDGKISGKEMVDAAELIQQLRTRNELDQSPENQVAMGLKRSQEAADVATAAYRKVNDLELKVDRGFGDLQKSLVKLSKGEPLVDPDDEPGGSIFDDDDDDYGEFDFLFDDDGLDD